MKKKATVQAETSKHRERVTSHEPIHGSALVFSLRTAATHRSVADKLTFVQDKSCSVTHKLLSVMEEHCSVLDELWSITDEHCFVLDELWSAMDEHCSRRRTQLAAFVFPILLNVSSHHSSFGCDDKLFKACQTAGALESLTSPN